MITEALLWSVAGLISGITALLPDLDIPYSAELDSLAVLIGTNLGYLNGVLPVVEVAVFLTWLVAAWVPVYLTFIVSRWVWAHVPVIGS